MFDELFNVDPVVMNPPNVKEGEAIIKIDKQESHVVDYVSEILYNDFNRVNIFSQRLSVGDYHITSPDGETEVIIERKSVEDLVASMKDGRTAVQVPELLDQEKSYFVIIGNVYDMNQWVRTNFRSEDSVTRYITGLSMKKSISGDRLPICVLPDHRQLAVHRISCRAN